MRRQPSPSRGRLWHALLAVLVLGGLGIWHGGHCLGDGPVRHSSTVAAATSLVWSQAPAAPTPGHLGGPAHTAVEVSHTAAADCHPGISTEPATTTSLTSMSPPAQQHTSTVVVVVTRQPVPRLLTARSPIEIGVSRT